MVDFYVDADDVLGSSYNVTSLECNNYNPSINGTVTVTVTVNDVYDDPVVGEVVTVTASAGNFTALNGESITAAATVDGTTDASGQFNLTYTCTSWGIINISANNINTQIRVTGYIQTSVNNGMYTIYEYEDRVGLRIHIPYDITFTTGIRIINDKAIPHRLAPRYPVMIVCANGQTATANTAIGVSESSDLERTEVIVKSLSGADVSRNAYAYVEWDKKY